MKSLRAGTPVKVHDLELIPIEMTYLDSHQIADGVFACAAKEPAAVVIRSRTGDRAIDLDGRDVSLEELLRVVSGLSDAISS